MLGISTDEQTGKNEDQVKSLVLENRTIIMSNVANTLTVSFESVQGILKESLNCISLLQN